MTRVRTQMTAWLTATLILAGAQAARAESAGFGRFEAEGGESLALGPSDIAAVDLQAGEEDSALYLALSDEAARVFGTLTERAVGQRLSLAICGAEVLDAVVQAPIRSGRVVIDGLAPDAARRLEAVLSGAAPCP